MDCSRWRPTCPKQQCRSSSASSGPATERAC
jgi:hypothetical protein